MADAEALPLGPGSVDLVVSLLALQAVNDLPGAMVQIRRALRPDGLFVACLLGGATLTELRQCLTQAESEIEGGNQPPRGALRGDPRGRRAAAAGRLQPAGGRFRSADGALRRRLRADARSAQHGPDQSLSERRKRPTKRATLLRAAQIYGETFSDPDGRIRAIFEFVWLSGWSPHESQQKPLKPGSAAARLADALGTVELKGDSPAG